MAINFIPNDPEAGAMAPPLRRKSPRANRPAGRAAFTFHDPEDEKPYETGTQGFLFWQCRESALAALEAWEALDANLTEWATGEEKLELTLNYDAPEFTGKDRLNASYDHLGLRFFNYEDDTQKVLSGASTCTVAPVTVLLPAFRMWPSR